VILSHLLSRLFQAIGIWVLSTSILSAQDSKTPFYQPTTLKVATFSKPDNGRVWDDLWFATDTDTMMGRRNTLVFQLNTAIAKPKSVGNFESLKDSKIVKSVNSTSGLWLIAESKRQVPFALNLTTHQQLNFTIEGLAVPGERTPTIQSWVYVSKSQAAVLMISGGDRATWPLDGNRPVYYWINFRTGQTKMMPIGSSLHYFSDDQNVALFSKGGSGEKFAIRMDTAERLKSYPNNRKTVHVPYN
jgi:hypothetical protein